MATLYTDYKNKYLLRKPNNMLLNKSEVVIVAVQYETGVLLPLKIQYKIVFFCLLICTSYKGLFNWKIKSDIPKILCTFYFKDNNQSSQLN